MSSKERNLQGILSEHKKDTFTVSFYLVAGPGGAPGLEDYACCWLPLLEGSDYIITPIKIGGPAYSLYGLAPQIGDCLGIAHSLIMNEGFTDTADFHSKNYFLCGPF